MTRLLIVLLILSPFATLAAPVLKVSPNHRYLIYEDGSPFFYLGDTAWELFHRLDRKEADLYLANRAGKGFTVIQAVALAELDGLNTPNVYGHRPLVENDPARPDVRDGPANDYWDHVDYIVNRAEKLGLFIGLLPTWGDKWVKRWGVGPEVFTPHNAETYGEFLGRRYRDKPVIWILGGDRSPDNDRHIEIIRAMARGLEKGDGGRNLMTFHPQGGNASSKWFHSDDWLDFNMFQSGHGRLLNPNYETTLAARALVPPKPVLDGEPCYEDHPVNWHRDGAKGWFDEWDVRRAAYMSMLAGAAGHTYGDHNIWQMWQPGREPISVARTPWPHALDHPASFQMGHFRRLFTLRPFHRLEPDQSLIIGDPGSGTNHKRAGRATDSAFALVYLPMGEPVTVDMTKVSGPTAKVWFFNPRQGIAEPIGEFPTAGERRFDPPYSGRNNDWVLIVDDASRNFPRVERGGWR